MKKSNSGKLCFMKSNLLILCVAGVHPSYEICSTPWKLQLYQVYQAALYILYIATLVAQLLGLYHYWGDVMATTDNLSMCTMGVITYVITSVPNWKEACDLIQILESKSVFCKCTTQSDMRKMKVLKQTQRIADLLTWFLFTCVGFMMATYICRPLVIKYTQFTSEHNSTADGGFPMVIWLPIDVTTNPAYVVVYAIVTCVIIAMVPRSVGMISFFICLLMYIAAQFRIVAISLENITDTDTKNGITHNEKNQTVSLGNLSEELDHFVFKISPEGNENPHQVPGTKSVPKVKSCKTDVSIDSEHCAGISEDTEELIVEHLVHGIKEHQNVIQFLNNTNSVWKMCIYFTENMVAFLLIISLFQLSQNVGVHENLKQAVTIFTILVNYFIFAWFGEDIQTHSLAVKGAAYNIQWYNHSTRFKKTLQMLIMRAQNPCYMNSGLYHQIGLKHFADILNASYTFFNLLVQTNRR